jgi:CRP-like cAMP-binding protein
MDPNHPGKFLEKAESTSDMENHQLPHLHDNTRNAESIISEFRKVLKRKLSKLSLSDNDVLEIYDAFTFRTYKKGTILLKPGQKTTEFYYILKGCVKEFYLVKGQKKTTFFHTEGEIIVSLTNGAKTVSKNHYLRCTEDTILAAISMEKKQELYDKYPEFETFIRAGIEKKMAAWLDMLSNYILSTPEKRYLELLKNQPEVISRISREQLASYIGVMPETLGKIRKRITAQTAKAG